MDVRIMLKEQQLIEAENRTRMLEDLRDLAGDEGQAGEEVGAEMLNWLDTNAA